MDIKTKLWGKDFTLVIIGQIISLFGNTILRFALPLYILETSKSPALFGRVSALSFLPMVLLSPIGGVIADRVNKQRVMVVLDFMTSGLILAYIIISGRVSALPVAVAFLMALFAIQGAYTPAVQSSIPLLVGADKLVSANAVVNLVASLSGMTGPVIGGMIYGIFDLAPILTVSCACFFLSAVLELFIRIPHKKRQSQGSVWTIVKNDIAGSVSFITKKKPILAKSIAVIFLFNTALSAMLMIGLPVLVTQNLGMGGRLYGITQGFMAAGSLAGGVLAGLLGKRLAMQRVYLLLLVCALTLFPIGFVLFIEASAFISYLIITAMCFLAAAAAALFQIQMFAFVQTVTPAELTGKVMSCLMALALCAQPVGQLIFGQLFEYFAGSRWLVVFGSAAVSCAVAMYSKKHFAGTGN